MRKLERRAILCLLLAAVFFFGIVYYVVMLVQDGGQWISFNANKHIYKDGYIAKGTIYDRNGKLLVKNGVDVGKKFNDSRRIRKATVHVTGDANGNIRTGANVAFADRLVGFNILTGTFQTGNKERELTLTIDADVCVAANAALAGRKGTVGVYNYKTGEIVCMVSSPNYDPTSPPDLGTDDDSGTFINKFISYTYLPGSTFKTITSQAVIEHVDYDDFSYNCTGSEQYGTAKVDTIRCTHAHGTVDFKAALAQSCNGAFGKLSLAVGNKDLEAATKKSGLTSSYSINGIKTATGSFDFPNGDINLAWAGIGQYHDAVNPCAMMVYMGAIANGGTAAQPRLIKNLSMPNGLPSSVEGKSMTEELIAPDTAKVLSKMMRNDVTSNYGQYRFPGLKIYAKSGTAELGGDKSPHAWFVGYIKNKNKPYAFAVIVENGGYGSEVAGSVANSVMQSVVEND